MINLNPTVRVDGGVIFEEARRILIAEWQHIIYQEWLPILLGPSYMKSFDLVPTTDSYNNNYDARMDPRINNEFSTAAFRSERFFENNFFTKYFQIWSQYDATTHCIKR